MLDRRVIGALAIAAALALGATTQASASPILGIELLEPGYSTWSTTSSTDPLTVLAKYFGTLKPNVEGSIAATGGIAAAPEIDAGSGTAAIALLLGFLGLVSERRRRTPAIA